MAFPVVAATNSSTTDADGTSHVVSLPTGISAGDLLICFLAGDGSGSWSLDEPTGWTRGFADENNSGGCNLSVRYKIADGGEGATQTFTSSASEKSSHHSFRITGAHATTPFTATGGGVAGSQGSSANPDAPSHTPSYGAADSLWIAVFGIDDNRSVTAYPTSYDDNQFTQVSGGSSGRCGLGLATRNLNATVDDPSAFTVDTTDVWLSATIAIQPGAGGAALTVTIDDTLALSDSFPLTQGKGVADTLALSDAQAFERGLGLADTLSLQDAVALGRELGIADTLDLSDEALAELGKEVLVDDTLSLDDALALSFGLGMADTVGLADALAFVRELGFADTLALNDELGLGRSLTLGDTIGLADELSALLTPPGGEAVVPQRTLMGVGT